MRLYFDGLTYKFNTLTTDRHVTLNLRVTDDEGRYVWSASEYLGAIDEAEGVLEERAEVLKAGLLARVHPDKCRQVALFLERRALDDARSEIEDSLRVALRDILGDMRNAGLLREFEVTDISVHIGSRRLNMPYAHKITVRDGDKT